MENRLSLGKQIKTAFYVLATALILLIAGIPKRIWAPFYLLLRFSN